MTMGAWTWKTMRGLTLMELLVTIAIIGILAALLIPATMNMRLKAAQTKAQAARATLKTAILNYHAEYGKWPVPNQLGPTTAKSRVIIENLRPPKTTRNLVFWEGDAVIKSEDGVEYSVTINPNGRYPIGSADDFSAIYAIYFSTE